jgi:thiol-disulfide isomerase/thioredoxin
VPLLTALTLAAGLLTDSLPPPDLQLQTLKKEPATLSDHRGQIVVLNFWATWCVPCRKEMPLFVELQNEYGPKGVQFIAASTDPAKDKKKVEKFAKEYKINFPVWTGARSEGQIAFRLGASLPATVILDTNGQPVFRIIGEASRDTLEKRLNWLLSNRNTPAPEEIVLPPGITPEHWKEHELGEEEDEHAHDQHAEEPGSEVPS